MRPTTSIIILLTALFVLNTGYQPIFSPQNNYTLFNATAYELTDHDASRSVVLKDVAYGENNEQVFDIYLPSNRGARFTKVLLLIHGGGWVRGDKRGMENVVDKLLDAHPDHAVVNMNYTLAGDSQTAFPQQFLDIQAVINHLTTLNDLYKINPEFGIIGNSAGAHLGLMYDNNFDTRDQVKFVVSIAGPTNFTDPRYAKTREFEILKKLLIDTETYREPNAIKSLSPLFQINSNSSPALILHGKDDKRVPVTNAKEYANSMDDLGITHSLRIYEGAHIGDWKPSDWSDAYGQLSLFVEAFL